MLQQDVRQLQEVLSLPGASKPSISQLQTPHQHHRDQNPSHHQTPSRSRTHRGVPAAVPQMQTSRQQTSARPPQSQPQPPPSPAPTTPEAGAAEDDEFVDFTPAAKRFQSPGTVIAAGSASSNSRPAQSLQVRRCPLALLGALEPCRGLPAYHLLSSCVLTAVLFLPTIRARGVRTRLLAGGTRPTACASTCRRHAR